MGVNYLGDFRFLNPSDKAKWDAAKNYYEQMQVMAETADFEVWNGKEWVPSSAFDTPLRVNR